MSNFFKELQRRNVIKAGISYAVISWAILQAADILFPAFGIPDSGIRYILYGLIGLFPLWIIFAYVFEWTPTGFKKTNEVAIETSIYRTTSKRLNSFIIGGLSLAVVLLVTDRMFNLTGGFDEKDENFNSIAVLPFENMSGADDAYFSAGITEDILTQISKIGELNVLSRFTLKEYDSKGKTPEEIGEELKIRHLLVGSVRRVGNQLRIGCQLIDTVTGTEVWAHSFDRVMADVFVIQSEVAKEIADILRVQLTDDEKMRIETQPTEDLDAYNLYLQAKALYNNANKEDNELAIKLFRKSLDLDPNFSLAWSSLARAYERSITHHSMRPYSFFDSTMVLNQKALELDPNSAEALIGLAYGHWVSGEDELAINYCEKGLINNPNDTRAMNVLGLILRNKGELDRAIPLFKKAWKLEPLRSHVYGYNIGVCYLFIGLYDQSLKYYQEVLETGQSKRITLEQLGYVHLSTGQYDELRKVGDALFALDSSARTFDNVGYYYHVMGDVEKAKSYYEKVLADPDFDLETFIYSQLGMALILQEEGNKEKSDAMLDEAYDLMKKIYEENGYWVAESLTSICAIRGDKEEALSWLQIVIDNGYLLDELVKKDIMLENLWMEPQFIKMMDEVALKRKKMQNTILALYPDEK